MTNQPSKPILADIKQLSEARKKRTSKKSNTAISAFSKDQLIDEIWAQQAELETQNEALLLAQLALAESNNHYLNLFENAPVSFLKLSTEGLIINANISAGLLIGVDRDQLLLSPFSRYLTKESADRHYLCMLRLRKQGKRQVYNMEIQCVNGTIRHVHTDAMLVKKKDGRIESRITLMDFTDQKNSEETALAEKSNRAAELVIANKELSFQSDEKSNRAAELVIANKELSFQSGEKANRAAELVIANKELSFQSGEKANRAAELVIANKELIIAATAFETSKAMIVTDTNSIILRANHTFTVVTGYNKEELIGKSPKWLSANTHPKAFYDAMWAVLDDTGAWEGEIQNRRKSGEVYPAHLTITTVKDENGTVTNYVWALTDISKSKAASNRIENLAFYDPLTQLPNRRLLLDRLSQALATSTRSGQRGALLLLDLDNFKTLNDTMGYGLGDLLLQEVANRLKLCIREGDTVARVGGDEFVVLLEDLSEHAIEAAAQTTQIAEKIILMLSQTYQLNTHDYHSTASIGATLFNGLTLATDELLKQADIAMYQSKIKGRNTLRFFDPVMQEAIAARVALESELRKAIELEQFQLHYQVQVNSSRQHLGAEALIRWQHPERGMISPFHFIPLAEETGLILPIGLWVLNTACAQIKTWQQDPATSHLIIAVNVSAKQFQQDNFVEQVITCTERYDINPTFLKLELTESILIENINDIILKMNKLSQIGIKFSLDDFGTGYSSLQYLKQLPINQLKIDQSFVRDISTDSSDRAIVHTIITMASSLNIDVIAEGVETLEQQQFLLENGCTDYQGYLFSKPLPLHEFNAFLRQN